MRFSRLVLALVSGYQFLDSAKHQLLHAVFGFSSVCRHRPTCSQYAAQQVYQHGTIVGLWRACIRLATCW